MTDPDWEPFVDELGIPPFPQPRPVTITWTRPGNYQPPAKEPK